MPPDPATIAALADALRQMGGDRVVTGVGAVDVRHLDRITDEEAALVTGAAPRRRVEFASGRVLLHDLAGEPAPILRSASGRPLLPSGRACSLAHDADVVVAAVAGPTVEAVGIDIEPEFELDRDEIDVVVRPDEDRRRATDLFVMKEAVYKAWSATGGELIGHHDVRVDIHDHRFRATITAFPDRTVRARSLGRPGSATAPDPMGTRRLRGLTAFDGTYRRTDGRCLALVIADDPSTR